MPMLPLLLVLPKLPILPLFPMLPVQWIKMQEKIGWADFIKLIFWSI
jgi:hypothetical protein